MHTLVTSSLNSPIYVWDIYSPLKPISKLETQGPTVISLKIHYPVGYLYSLTVNGLVEVWDLKDDNKVQSVELRFPINGPLQPDFGPFPMSLYSNESESKNIQSELLRI